LVLRSKVVGVFVRFRAPLHTANAWSEGLHLNVFYRILMSKRQ
jgi:hypothetical protein